MLVLDRGELTGGSTFHSAGLVGQLRSTIALTRINMASVELYRRLRDDTGVDPGWREVGSLRLASSKERLLELRRQVGWARTFGLPLSLISAEEARSLFPLMSLAGVEGAAYLSTDGRIDPASLAGALAAGARKRGVRIRTGVNVLAVKVIGRRVTAVETEQGTVPCEVVVNAAGIWSHELGRMVGLAVPVIPMAHQYLVTKPIDGVTRDIPTMRDPDRLVYFREEVGGLLMGGYERVPAPWGLDGIPRDFTHKLLAPDWERFGDLMEYAISRVPALGRAEVITLINGPEAFTPDGEFIMGEAPDVRGFFVAAGFCAHGIAGAGGVGKVMARWILDGRPSIDVWRMDLRRFGGHYHDRGYARAQAVETYSTCYDIHYPGEERRTGRGLKRSPVHARVEALGAAFGEKAGWERPNWVEANVVRLDKGDFIGREALVKQKADGLTNKLVCLTLADPTVVALGGEPILAEGRTIGRVTSGGYGYTVGASIAYAYVPVASAAPGTRLAVELFGETIGAIVSREPLYEPRGQRIRGGV